MSTNPNELNLWKARAEEQLERAAASETRAEELYKIVTGVHDWLIALEAQVESLRRVLVEYVESPKP
jgi:hypothetical protein